MIGLDLEQLQRQIDDFDGCHVVGKLRTCETGFACALPAAVGDQCAIAGPNGREILGEVIGFSRGLAHVMAYEHAEDLRVGQSIRLTQSRRKVPTGDAIRGRVLDGLGRPIDQRGPLQNVTYRDVRTAPLPALERQRIQQPFVTGQKVLDGLLTIGRGQRVGIFAGSGVGKSTLMGQVARSAEADVNVIALVGERGCELRPFIEDCLGPRGLERSVVVMSSSDQLPLMRIRAVETAIAIAHSFRERGLNVLFFLDSLTRMAMAQRELGLSVGEPPSARGYTPSVFTMMANTLERLGNDVKGSITGIVTVLVDGDDMDEPIADAARSILDGHIVLSRRMAERGHYPAIDVSASVSRSFLNITDSGHQLSARRIRAIMSTYSDVEDLIRIGAYQKGTSPQVDKAVDLMPAVNSFLKQDVNERYSVSEMRAAMDQIAGTWHF